MLRADCSGIATSPWTIAGAAFAARVYGLLLTIHAPALLWISGLEMGNVAASLVAGHGFGSPFGPATGPTAFVTPGYPLLIAVVFKIFGPFSFAATWAVLILQAAVSALVVVPILWLGKAGHRSAAVLAAWIWALYPTLAGQPGLRIWETYLSGFFMITAVVLALQLREDSRRRLWLGFGLLWGAASMVNAALVLAPAALLAWVALLRLRKGVATVALATCSLAVFAAVLLPWNIRNYRTFGTVIPLRTNFPFEFLDGNLPENGGYFNPHLHPFQNPEEMARYRREGEVAYMAEDMRTAMGIVRSAPGHFVAMSARRAARFWIGMEPDNVLWSTLPLVLLAFLGLALTDASERWAYVIPMLVFPAPYYIAHSELRFREVLEPLLVLLAARAMVWIAQRLRQEKRALTAEAMGPAAEAAPAAAMGGATMLAEGARTAVIIGAGPAGLTAAYELLTRTSIKPIILEKSAYIGGLARTVDYKGNRLDIGPHRFFSKSDRVMNWWLQHMPLQTAEAGEPSARPGMIVCKRQTRIYFLRKFFDYPIRLSMDTLSKLGWQRNLRIGASYLRASLFPLRRVVNLEQFFINRFGRELYRTFFKSYTEKVWGVSCTEISAEWGEQRIKGLSILKAITHFVKQTLPKKAGLEQRNTETSLIEQFLYPQGGAGKMWELVARRVQEMGGEIHTGCDVKRLELEGGCIRKLVATTAGGAQRTFAGDVFFSTMPVQELVRALGKGVPGNVAEVSDGLMYRDMVNIGLLLKRMKVNQSQLIPDNWIYLQEGDVLAGRLQIFNNWGPEMVARPDTVWIGVEYFCYENDELWRKSDAELARLATEELSRIGLIEAQEVLDSTVIRTAKTYPAYFGTYSRFGEIRQFVDSIGNLYLLGRNGMHKYNNQDHSMLTAMVAVDNIVAGHMQKANVWEVNTEQEYHEAKRETARRAAEAGRAAVAAET